MEPRAPGPVVPQPGTDQSDAGRRPAWLLTAGAFIASIALIVAAIWIVPDLAGSVGKAAAPASQTSDVAAATASAAPSLLTPVPTTAINLPPATAGAPISLSNGRVLARTGAMAVVSNDNSLTLIGANGRTVVLAPGSQATFAFPAWSPDGTRLAAIRTDAMGPAILVFEAKRALAGEPVEPTVIFRSGSIRPFYLAWTPDGRGVSFLADDPDVLSLRIAPADGSAPLDGSGPGSKIRSGNPFYFDWIGSDRLLAHVGTGADAFLGVIGLDGSPIGPPLTTPGDFRSAAVNDDASLIGYVRGGGSGSSAVVVRRPDGSAEHAMPVFGMAGMAFDPTGDTLASIGPTAPRDQPLAIPIGPLRLLDPGTGRVRQLLGGDVVSFWWSPDGRTIAALRVQPIGDGSGSRTPASSASPPASAAAATAGAPSAAASVLPSASAAGSAQPSTPTTEAQLIFVDVASGHTESQSVVQPSDLFIDQFLTFFDQYATSHRIWAPDSSSVVVPVSDFSASPRLALMPRNGDPRILLDGDIAFWSP